MPSYFPPASSGGLTLPAGSGGLTAGLVGVELDGAAQALGSPAHNITFDTVYSDPDVGDSAALSADVDTADYTFKTTGIGVKAGGLYLFAIEVDFSAALTKACHIQVTGALGGALLLPVPAGISSFNGQLLGVVKDARDVLLAVQNVNAADAAVTITYASFAVAKLAGVTPT